MAIKYKVPVAPLQISLEISLLTAKSIIYFAVSYIIQKVHVQESVFGCASFPRLDSDCDINFYFFIVDFFSLQFCKAFILKHCCWF